MTAERSPRLEQTIAILRRLVAFDTTSRNSNLDLIAWIEGHLDGLGVRHHRIPSADGCKANLFATVGPEDVPGYVLSGHTDVVPVDGQAWSSDPFTLTERDGRLVGRGTTDMKGFLASCLAAVPEMTAAPLRRPVHLAFSYDEELGCLGVHGMIADMKARGLAPLGCFVGEPTSMQVVTGHKGKRRLDVEVRGKACHSSIAPMGVNAVEHAAHLVVFIRQLADRLAREGARDALYDVPFTTGHVGPIQGGTALNIVPDRCRFEFEFRALPADDLDRLIGEVTAYARDVLEPMMHAVDPATGIEVIEQAGFPGLETAADAPITTLAKRLAGRNDHAKVAYGTEAGLFHVVGGVPTVVVGPGAIADAHTPDESIAISQLEQCDRFVAGVIATCRD